MKVILRADIVNVGRQGEIKDVSEGYARNFLMPRRLVMEANSSNMKIWEKEKIRLEKERDKIINDAKLLAEKIEKISLTIPVKVGENGRIFGSVTNGDIAEGLEKNGHKIGKADILLSDPIKEIGAFTVTIRLHPEVTASIKVWVVEEKEEKEKTEVE